MIVAANNHQAFVLLLTHRINSCNLTLAAERFRFVSSLIRRSPKAAVSRRIQADHCV
jgi:hypothetical protein